CLLKAAMAKTVYAESAKGERPQNFSTAFRLMHKQLTWTDPSIQSRTNGLNATRT
ncbi:hypothetical protein BaRGS_00039955, partial [Batillaria attramentaria]